MKASRRPDPRCYVHIPTIMGAGKLIAFDGVARPIALVHCDNLLALFEAVLHGWHFHEVASANAAPIISIGRRGVTYRLESPWLDEPYHDPTEVGIVCAFVVDLVQAYVADNPELLCLHCGAVELAGRLVIFPSQYRAGKSTLVAGLAAAGARAYADDVLPIARSADQGVALGIAPRLRRPLPRNAGPRFRRFVECHRGPGNRRYLYLNLPPTALAPHRRKAPIGAFVLLDRRPSGEAQLAPAAKSAGLQRVILQNFARTVAAMEIAGRLRSLVDRVPCFTLRYSELEEAVALLQEAFRAWPPLPEEEPSGCGPVRPALCSPDRSPSPKPAEGGARPRYVQNPAVVLDAVDDDLFLVNPRRQSIYHLNAVGAGVWHMLREPTAAAEAIEVFRGAFPDLDRRQIERDVTRLFSDLLAGELIVSPPAADLEVEGTVRSSMISE